MPKIVHCPSRGNRDASNKKNGQVMFTKKRERALPRGNRDKAELPRLGETVTRARML